VDPSGPSESQDQANASCPQNQEGPAEQSEPQNSPPGVPGDHSTALCLDQAQSQLGSSVTIEMPNVQSAMELSVITGDGEGHSSLLYVIG